MPSDPYFVGDSRIVLLSPALKIVTSFHPYASEINRNRPHFVWCIQFCSDEPFRKMKREKLAVDLSKYVIKLIMSTWWILNKLFNIYLISKRNGLNTLKFWLMTNIKCWLIFFADIFCRLGISTVSYRPGISINFFLTKYFLLNINFSGF